MPGRRTSSRSAERRIEIAPEPVVPDGWEAVVSSAYPDVPGLRRRDFLGELVTGRRSIVVAGSHGKGTTAAMIAFVLRETGRDPAWLIGAPVPQLGANAGTGAGWLVVEGDESDRTVFSLPAEIAVVTNIELDHHSEFASLAELEAAFDTWLATAGTVVRDAPPYQGELALPGELNRLNAGSALAALDAAGVPRTEAEPALARFAGTGRRFEVHERGGVTIVDDYAHHPTEIARDDRRGPRALSRPPAARPLPAAPLFADEASRDGARRGAGGRRRRHRDRRLRRPRAAGPRSHGEARRRCALRSRRARGLDADRRGRRGATSSTGAPGRRRARGRGGGRRPRRRPARGGVDGGPGPALAAHDDRHRRSCTLARTAGDARRAAGGTGLGGGRRRLGRGDRARLERARARRRGRGAGREARRASSRERGSRARRSSPAGVRRTPCASTARVPPGSAGSSSRRRSRARPEAGCG